MIFRLDSRSNADGRSGLPQPRGPIVLTRPGDRRLASWYAPTAAAWEADGDPAAPVYLVVGPEAPDGSLERLARRWSMPVEQLRAARDQAVRS